MTKEEFDDEVRATIASSCWEYNDSNDYGRFEQPPASPMGELLRKVAIDQAEYIRRDLAAKGFLSRPAEKSTLYEASKIWIAVMFGLALGSWVVLVVRAFQ